MGTNGMGWLRMRPLRRGLAPVGSKYITDTSSAAFTMVARSSRSFGISSQRGRFATHRYSQGAACSHLLPSPRSWSRQLWTAASEHIWPLLINFYTSAMKMTFTYSLYGAVEDIDRAAYISCFPLSPKLISSQTDTVPAGQIPPASPVRTAGGRIAPRSLPAWPFSKTACDTN